MIPLLFACLQSADDSNAQRKPGALSEDGFSDAGDVRIGEPYSGEVVGGVFTVAFDFGADVDLVRVFLDGEASTGFEKPGKGRLELQAESGRYQLELIGYDDRRTELSRDMVDVRVRDDSGDVAWVGITTPVDGAHPLNPVVFSAAASEGISSIEFTVDDWPIGSISPGASFTYTFEGVGFEREIEATAYAGEEVVASDLIHVTVEESVVEPGPTDFNELVIKLVESYPKDGTYTYYWPSGGGWSGSTRDLYYQGEKIADHGGYSACYCSGITFEWYLRAWQEWAETTGADGEDLNGIGASAIWQFRRDWYVRELKGPGPTAAMENYGVGTDVGSFDNWQRGDFVQLWRNNGSGHTVVFWGWILDEESNIVGMEYASCQGATDGLGISKEYFGSFSGALDPQYMWAARAWLPERWL